MNGPYRERMHQHIFVAMMNIIEYHPEPLIVEARLTVITLADSRMDS